MIATHKRNLLLSGLLAAVFYSDISLAQNSPVPFLRSDGTYEYVDPVTFQPVFNKRYRLALPFSNNRAVVAEQDQQYYIGPDGARAFGKSFTEASSFRGEKAAVYEDNQTVLIDKNGNESRSVFKIQEWTINEDRAVATDKKGKSGFIALGDGLSTLDFIYDAARPYHEEKAAVLINGKWGFIDKKGQMVIPALYEEVTAFDGGMAGIRQGSKWGVIDQSGRIKINPRYEKITSFSNGRAFVKIAEGSWGIIDQNGMPVSAPLPFQQINPLSEGRAAFLHGSNWGYIDASGKIIIPADYLRVSAFDNGVAMVVKDGRRFYINKEGREFRDK